jgi:organic hydroperoxide reductase OsmC/OhrA
MTTLKTHRFPVDVHWQGDKLTVASVSGKHDLKVATPPEFLGGVPGVWSPEDLFVAAVATCYAVTLAGIAARRSVPLSALDVRSAGFVTQRRDGHYGFVAVELDVSLETVAGWENEARGAALDAEEACLVGASLDTPVHVSVDVRAAAAA